jgi:DNA-binding cell septation regulator SpoVG
MKITLEMKDGKWQSFNINLHSKEGADAFLVIRDCRMVEHQKGRFISFPAKKNEKTDKWWNHVWASDAFQESVKDIYDAMQPKPKIKTAPVEDDLSDVPF